MIRYRLRMLFLTGVLGGISLSVLYINPYGGEISLSEALLQLSGSRGDFPMGFASDGNGFLFAQTAAGISV